MVLTQLAMSAVRWSTFDGFTPDISSLRSMVAGCFKVSPPLVYIRGAKEPLWLILTKHHGPPPTALIVNPTNCWSRRRQRTDYFTSSS